MCTLHSSCTAMCTAPFLAHFRAPALIMGREEALVLPVDELFPAFVPCRATVAQRSGVCTWVWLTTECEFLLCSQWESVSVVGNSCFALHFSTSQVAVQSPGVTGCPQTILIPSETPGRWFSPQQRPEQSAPDSDSNTCNRPEMAE